MGPPQHDFLEDSYHDPIEPWVMLESDIAMGAAGPSRPPVLNRDNCSCEELAGATSDLELCDDVQQDALTAAAQFARMTITQPQSCSSDSVNGREDPDTRDPIDDHLSNYICLAPELGQGEMLHRYSFEANRPLVMAWFLEEQSRRIDQPSAVPSEASRYLSLGVHIRSQVSTRATKGTKTSLYSDRSFYSGDPSGNSHAWAPDMINGVGEWAAEIDYPLYGR